MMRQMESVLEGQNFDSADELNARLSELTGSGKLQGMAAAWNRDDPKWRAQDLAYDALETDDFETALRLIGEAIKLDPECTDAQRLMVSLLPQDSENKLHLMREVVEIAELKFGDKFFDEHKGHFWGKVTTRPYMRAKQHLGELLAEAGRVTEAIAVFERMLELNPRDNQGMRFVLASLYLASNQPEGVAGVLARYKGEEGVSSSFAWARVMERWLSGNMDEASAALAHARKLNPFAARYFSGIKPAPRRPPEYFEFGQDSEAQACAFELAIALDRHPGFRNWVRERL
jgi:tetratricopeptide (TPR) repeat protein